MIIKLQMPVAGDMTEALVYNEDRSLFSQIPITPQIKDLMAESYKEFFEAEIDEKGILNILDYAEWQPW